MKGQSLSYDLCVELADGLSDELTAEILRDADGCIVGLQIRFRDPEESCRSYPEFRVTGLLPKRCS